MKYIISGTNRPGSRTLQISQIIQNIYASHNSPVELIDLQKLPFNELSGAEYADNQPHAFKEAISKVGSAEGIIIVAPEYNGSMPGILKYFIDHWKFPESFESRPVCFVGLGGIFGGLRPVEHLQQVFGYRNAFIFPQRVFLFNVWNNLKDGIIQDKLTNELLNSQAEGFIKFIEALKSQKLDANSKKSLS